LVPRRVSEHGNHVPQSGPFSGSGPGSGRAGQDLDSNAGLRSHSWAQRQVSCLIKIPPFGGLFLFFPQNNKKTIGTNGVVYTSMLEVKFYDYGKIN